MLKRFVSILVVCFCVSFTAVAQPFEYGTNVVSGGIGLGGNFGLGRYAGSPGLSVQFEHGLVDVPGPGVVSVGGYLGTKGYRYHHNAFGYWYKENWRYTILGVRSAYHYNGHDIPELDLYGGAMISYNVLTYKYRDNDPFLDYTGRYNNRLGFSLYAGGRYFFTPNVAGFGELGYGVSYLTIGAALKL